MNAQTIEVRINEKESAHYFSNAAALYVLGVGFAVFAVKAQSAFVSGACFWFSVFMLCDCLRLTRACQRIDSSQNRLLTLNAEGITHYGSWLNPETVPWKQITALRFLKNPQSETCFFVATSPQNFFRLAFFGAPKFDLPLSAVPGGKATVLAWLDHYPAAKHLVPERAALPAPEEIRRAA